MTNKLLNNKSVIISGGGSGIGREVALLFANEGANVCILYHSDKDDALKTKNDIINAGAKSFILGGDINEFSFCEQVVDQVLSEWGSIDILVNNAGVQFPNDDITKLKEEDIRKTFDSNIIGMILLTKAVFPHLSEGSSIINTTSAVAYQGHEELIDYAATKGAVISFTRSLALQAKKKGIRVNAVAPGPVATPLTEETFEQNEEDLSKPPLERNASSEEIAPSFLFLASNSSVQITGQVLHPNGGIIVNG